MKLYLLVLVIVLLVTACGDSSTMLGDDNNQNLIVTEPLSSEKLPIPDNQNGEEFQVLLIGNSHTSPINHILARLLLESAASDKVRVLTIFTPFLDSSVANQNYIDTLKNNKWTHVVLQGQKYSQSQIALYPTLAAKLWIQRAKSQHAMPILFPEHPSEGNFLEAEYVHEIHSGIASQEPSCVAPVGLTWDLALENNPRLNLYANDGNHASQLGALLSALVIYEVITGQSADLLAYIAELPGDENEQDFLGQMASEVIAGNSPCAY